MSEVVQGALIGVFSALGGVIITQVGAFFLEKRRELANYRVNLYGKCLEVHQQAYIRLVQLYEDYESVRRVVDIGAEQAVISRGNQLSDRALDLRQWLIANRFYLDRTSQEKIISFVNHVVGQFPSIREAAKAADLIREAIKALETGIGMKHLHLSSPHKEVGEG